MTAADAETGSPGASRILRADALARVEGEGAFSVRVRDGVVREVKVRMFEPPRFFEALLRGRMYRDAPDIASRLCGVSPVAYSMGASQAMEMALGAALEDPALLRLRRLLCCGEWLRSHVLHSYFFHAPDFMGCRDILEIAGSHPGVVERALRMKALGNRILELVGGRAVHPVNTRVGGFYKAPRRERVRRLIEPLTQAVADAVETIRLFAGFPVPDYEDDYTFVALHHPGEYAIERGRIRSNRGLDIGIPEFEEHLEQGLAGVAGPLARYALNYEQLTPLCRKMAGEAGLGPVVRNPFKSLTVRAIEMLYVCQEALRLAEACEDPEKPALDLVPRAGRGHGGIEAPRGLCCHRYDLDEDGRILAARIVSLAARNQTIIERDLRGVVQRSLTLSDEDLKGRCEQAIRNYDPCPASAAPLTFPG